MKRQNILLLLACVIIAVVPLLTVKQSGDKEIFTGSDDHAADVITTIDPHYKRWFKPFWEPPSSEVEGLLFGLQAAIGAGLLGYCVGFYRGLSRPAGGKIPNPK